VQNFGRKRSSVGTPERRLEDNIKADLQEIEHQGIYWTEEAERGLQWREVVKRAVKLLIL
jgi:hypothetical protein